MPRAYRRRRRRHLHGFRMPFKAVLFLFAVTAISYWLLTSVPDDTDEARKTADLFYSLEKDSDFAGSWELFHPYMKKKFDKNGYIQNRNHVFMQHFGVKTFEYNIGSVEKIPAWTMSADSPVLDDVYKVQVTQHYKSMFGTFDLKQEVFVAQYEGEWTILWSYN